MGRGRGAGNKQGGVSTPGTSKKKNPSDSTKLKESLGIMTSLDSQFKDFKIKKKENEVEIREGCEEAYSQIIFRLKEYENTRKTELPKLEKEQVKKNRGAKALKMYRKDEVKARQEGMEVAAKCLIKILEENYFKRDELKCELATLINQRGKRDGNSMGMYAWIEAYTFMTG